jgi:hypothetical protein
MAGGIEPTRVDSPWHKMALNGTTSFSSDAKVPRKFLTALA